MGKILLEGIEVMVRIGLLEEELYARRIFYYRSKLNTIFPKSAKTDEVEDGIDYRNIVDHIEISHKPMMVRPLRSMLPYLQKI